MVWKQLTDLMWVNDDGVMLKLIPKTQVGMKRHTQFWIYSIFNTHTDIHLVTSESVKEKKEILAFIFKKIPTHFIGESDWSRALNDLNQQRKLYFDFEEQERGSFYDIKYQKCF